MLAVALDVTDRSVLVIGAGLIGLHKATQLINEGARVSIVATELRGDVPVGVTDVAWRAVRSEDLDGRFLVVAATGSEEADAAIRHWAAERGVLLNVADVPDLCDFYFTAVHRQGSVVLSVSTEGASPALAGVLRDRLSQYLPPSVADVASTLAAERAAARAAGTEVSVSTWRQRAEELLDQE